MTFKRRQHTARKVAVGSVVAGVAGYLAGILTAPKSGQGTREDIARKATEVRSSAEDELQEINEELNDLVKTTKDKTQNLSSSAKAELNEAMIRAKDAQNKAAQVLRAVKNGEASDPDLNKAVKQGKLALKNLGRYLKN